MTVLVYFGVGTLAAIAYTAVGWVTGAYVFARYVKEDRGYFGDDVRDLLAGVFWPAFWVGFAVWRLCLKPWGPLFTMLGEWAAKQGAKARARTRPSERAGLLLHGVGHRGGGGVPRRAVAPRAREGVEGAWSG